MFLGFSLFRCKSQPRRSYKKRVYALNVLGYQKPCYVLHHDEQRMVIWKPPVQYDHLLRTYMTDFCDFSVTLILGFYLAFIKLLIFLLEFLNMNIVTRESAKRRVVVQRETSFFGIQYCIIPYR